MDRIFFIPSALKSGPWHIHFGVPLEKNQWVGYSLDLSEANQACAILNKERDGLATVHLRDDFKYPDHADITVLVEGPCGVNRVEVKSGQAPATS